MDKPGWDYKQAGVDIDAASTSVEMIKKWVGMTRRPEVMNDIGAFAGFFALDVAKYQEPVLVSGTDGVGTKLKIAQMMGIHDTVGVDLVAMCVNDILVHGAEPLFFLDYIGVGQLQPAMIEMLVKGVSLGCVQAGCALIGGETAEMPGFYSEDEYDLAGFAVGAVEKSRLIRGHRIENGDVLLGLPSSGLHSNGFSLARKVLLEHAAISLEQYVPELQQPLGEALLTPTRIYVKPILELLNTVDVHGMAHITGGGMTENLARVLPAGLGAGIEQRLIDTPPIFSLIAELGRVDLTEMFRTFNMGIGFILAVAPNDADRVVDNLRGQGETPCFLGQISDNWEGVRLL
ncbi:MAG: phosphoribosylformylglycinamidine cyclo-ligase [Syntrophomonadaceae bacterium]|jgi:phosphoribosylformylglycinamidine cyclo-ligase